MAAHAVARRAAEEVAAVARGTGRLRVEADQREGRLVIEPRLVERDVAGPVTGLARRGEARGHVVGRLRRLVVLLVATEAGRVGGLEVAVQVTRLAGELAMRPVERHAGVGGMIEPHRRPRDRPMALLALRAELQLVAVVLPALPVTVEAPRRRALEHVVDVARLARHVAVPALEGKAGLVVKLTVRGLELGLGRRGERQGHGQEQEQEVKEPVHRGGPQGRWHVSQAGPRLPRWMSV
jgi:hypothetical protein